MTDLSHWDVCDAFTGMEAACLFVGVDPNNEPEHFASKPILRRMRTDYERALHAFLDELHLSDMKGGYPKKHLRFFLISADTSFFDHMLEEAREAMYCSEDLYSWRMTAFLGEEDKFWASADLKGTPSEREKMLFELAKDSFERWLRRGNDTDFEHQLFHRTELVRWIKVHGYSSQYNFRVKSKDDESPARVFPLLSRIKRDILTPAIELGASSCRNPMDVAELWTALQTLARQGTPPLIGVTETGIQYLDSCDSPKEFTKRALRERLRRSEY